MPLAAEAWRPKVARAAHLEMVLVRRSYEVQPRRRRSARKVASAPRNASMNSSPPSRTASSSAASMPACDPAADVKAALALVTGSKLSLLLLHFPKLRLLWSRSPAHTVAIFAALKSGNQSEPDAEKPSVALDIVGHLSKASTATRSANVHDRVMLEIVSHLCEHHLKFPKESPIVNVLVAHALGRLPERADAAALGEVPQLDALVLGPGGEHGSGGLDAIIALQTG